MSDARVPRTEANVMLAHDGRVIAVEKGAPFFHGRVAAILLDARDDADMRAAMREAANAIERMTGLFWRDANDAPDPATLAARLRALAGAP